MASWKKALWGFGAVAQLVLMAPIWVLAISTGFGQHVHGYRLVGLMAMLGWSIYVVTEITALVYVYRSKFLPRESRRRWLWGLFILNGLVLPVFWWRVIRPLPDNEGGSDPLVA
jgi:hypothetical protein